MPRKPYERSDLFPYHVTARTNRREDFPLEMRRVWEIFGEVTLQCGLLYGAQAHALVLMPNHFHLLLTVPERDLGWVMQEFMKSVTRRINLLSGQQGHVFGGPYYRSLIKTSRYFGHAFKYVYRNPVKAKLVDRVESYPFSTLYGLLGSGKLPFPIHLTRVGMEDCLPATDPADQLDWLNTPFPSEAETLIQKGLRKRIFDSIIDRKTRMPHAALSRLV